MKRFIALMLMLCMLLVAATAMADQPLDVYDSPDVALMATALPAVTACAVSATEAAPTGYTDMSSNLYATGRSQRVWDPNVGLIDLFWWLRK